jgi:hypothetical protein
MLAATLYLLPLWPLAIRQAGGWDRTTAPLAVPKKIVVLEVVLVLVP